MKPLTKNEIKWLYMAHKRGGFSHTSDRSKPADSLCKRKLMTHKRGVLHQYQLTKKGAAVAKQFAKPLCVLEAIERLRVVL